MGRKAVSRLTVPGFGVVLVLIVLGGVSLVGAHGGDANQVHSCVNDKQGIIRIVGPDESCQKGESALDWNKQGPSGPQGPQGQAGSGGISNYQVLFRNETVNPGSFFSFTASCQDPRRALSGGYDFQDFPEGLRIFTAGVTNSAGFGFQLAGANDTQLERQVTIFVVCADIASQLPSAIAP